MQSIILNGHDFSTKEELHAILKKEFNFPEYYGNNLDALFDCLTDYLEIPLTLKWKNFKQSKINLGNYADAVLAVFQEVAPKFNEFNIIIL